MNAPDLLTLLHETEQGLRRLRLRSRELKPDDPAYQLARRLENGDFTRAKRFVRGVVLSERKRA